MSEKLTEKQYPNKSKEKLTVIRSKLTNSFMSIIICK